MLKHSWAVWCNYTDTRCIRSVHGDTQVQALNYAKMNGWYVQGSNHYCPYHGPNKKK